MTEKFLHKRLVWNVGGGWVLGLEGGFGDVFGRWGDKKLLEK